MKIKFPNFSKSSKVVKTCIAGVELSLKKVGKKYILNINHEKHGTFLTKKDASAIAEKFVGYILQIQKLTREQAVVKDNLSEASMLLQEGVEMMQTGNDALDTAIENTATAMKLGQEMAATTYLIGESIGKQETINEAVALLDDPDLIDIDVIEVNK